MPAPSLKQTTLIAFENVRKEALASENAEFSIPPSLKKSDRIAYILTDKKLCGAVMKEMDRLIAATESRVSPASKKKRAAAEARWIQLVQGLDSSISSNDAWHESIIMKYYQYMLPILLIANEGTKGRKHIKAMTLQSYKEVFVWAIAKHARDSEGLACGSILLSRGGILSMLDDQVFSLTNQYKLQRTLDEKLYYGENEMKLFIQESMRMSQKTGRLICLEKICIVLTIFFSSVRPGSLGPSHKDYENQGKFPKLCNLRIYRHGFMTFKVELNLENFKGNNNTAAALCRKYVYQPVVQWYNVHVDLSLYYVAFMLARGALDGISSIEELRNDNRFEIPIKESMWDLPLFPALKEGGKHFAENGRPISAHGITDLIRVVTGNAGLAQGTAYCFRRGAANDYEILLGKDSAEHLLTHKTTGALHYYSENTANIDVVGARLNELPIPTNANKQYLLNNKAATSRAVQAVIHLLTLEKTETGDDDNDSDSQVTPVDSIKVARNERSVAVTLSQDQKKQALAANREYQILSTELDNKWDEFINCFPPLHRSGVKQGYKKAQMNIGVIRKDWKPKPTVLPIDVDKAEAALRAAFKEQNDLRKRIFRVAQREITRADMSQRISRNDGTTEDIQNALEYLATTNPMLLQPPQLCNPGLFTDAPRSLADITERLANQSVMEAVVEKGAVRPTCASSAVIPFTPLSEHISETTRVSAPGSSFLPILEAGIRAGNTASIVPPAPQNVPTVDSSRGPIVSNLPDVSLWPGNTTGITPPVPPISPNLAAKGPGADAGCGSQYDEVLKGLVYTMDWAVEDIQNDEEPDQELELFNQRLRNLGAGEQQPSTSDSQVDNDKPLEEDETPCSITDTESKIIEPNAPATADVRSEYIETLIAPIVVQRAFQALKPLDDGRYRCPRCEQHFHHDPLKQRTTYSSISYVERHVTLQHTAWNELVLLMFKEGSNYYHCPECDFMGKSEDEVRTHCIEECMKKETFIAVQARHVDLLRKSRKYKRKYVHSAEDPQDVDDNKQILGVQRRIANQLMSPIEDLRDIYPEIHSAIKEATEVIARNRWLELKGCTKEEYESVIGCSYDDLLSRYNM